MNTLSQLVVLATIN